MKYIYVYARVVVWCRYMHV